MDFLESLSGVGLSRLQRADPLAIRTNAAVRSAARGCCRGEANGKANGKAGPSRRTRKLLERLLEQCFQFSFDLIVEVERCAVEDADALGGTVEEEEGGDGDDVAEGLGCGGIGDGPVEVGA